jgi:hypothetical protein
MLLTPALSFSEEREKAVATFTVEGLMRDEALVPAQVVPRSNMPLPFPSLGSEGKMKMLWKYVLQPIGWLTSAERE